MSISRLAFARSTEGFTLVEVLIALVLVAIMAAGSAALFVAATGNSRRARARTSATILAVQKLEQLRALSWGGARRANGVTVTDTVTDLGHDPPTAAGAGLSPSPPGSLAASLDGYADYLDESGLWVGSGATPPPRAVWVRRWSAQPLAGDPDTLVLEVLVRGTGRSVGDVRLASVKTRKAE